MSVADSVSTVYTDTMTTKKAATTKKSALSPVVTKMVRVTLPEDVWTKMRVAAAEEDTSVSGWVSFAAWQYVDAHVRGT